MVYKFKLVKIKAKLHPRICPVFPKTKSFPIIFSELTNLRRGTKAKGNYIACKTFK